MSDFLPHPFWNFSLEIYAGEGVAEACLDLQARRGCDVNVLLFCCWLGASGRPTLTADRLRTILRASDVWQAEIVRGRLMRLSSFDPAAVNRLLAEMRKEAEAVVRQGAPDAPLTEQRSAFMRYRGQGHEIAVDLPAREFSAADRATITTLFEDAYRRIYSRPIPAWKSRF